MTVQVLDANQDTQTVQTLDDLAKGAGAASAATLRMILSSDDPAVVSLAAMVISLAAVAASAAAMDDWDESDRAKVNLIAGQAGVAGGAGARSAATQRMTIATDDSIAKATEGDYETVAASQTDQVLGATGAAGDYLSALLIIPATTSPGAVQIKDGAGSAITVFTGGASSVSNLVPFTIPLGMLSTSGAWKITTGANVSAVGIGSFT